MKTIKYLFFALVTACVLAGCTDDLTYSKGDPEDANSYGVYFPSQENADDLELDPLDPMTVTFTAMRTNDTDAITVPLVVTGSTDIFNVSELSFAEGQTETTFEVTFPNAEIGTTYPCNISIVDKKYAMIYGEKSTGIDFSVTRVKWNLVTGPEGETKGKWRDDIISSGYNLPGVYAETDVEIYERDDNPGYFRIANVYSDEYLTKLFVQFSYLRSDQMTYIDATDPEKVWFPQQSTGATAIEDDGEVLFGSLVQEAGFNGTSYGKLENGIITFPVKGIALGLGGKWYALGNSSGMQRIMMPGAKEYDYSLALSKSEPAEGKVSIGVKIGADVAKVKYAFFEGALSTTLAAAKSGDIEAGILEGEVKELTESGTLQAQFDATGMYTIVANVYNDEGALQSYQYMPFGYTVAGEEKPVVMTMGLIVSNKYAGKGYTSEDSVEFYASGEEIESGYYGLFETDALLGVTDLAGLVKSKGAAFTADEIAAINTDGLSLLIGGLNGGTEYTIVVCAYNGYVSEVKTADAMTEGTPHPLKRNYTMADFMEQQPDKASYSKMWEYYAVDKKAKPANTRRVKIGEVTLADNTTDDIPADPADPESTPTDFMDITGLSGIASDLTGGDKMLIEYSEGLLIVYTPQRVGNYGNYIISTRLTAKESDGLYYGSGLIIGAMVEEGYVAFVPNPFIQEQEKLTFNGLYFAAYNDEAQKDFQGGVAWYEDLMFVDPAVAEEASAPAAVLKPVLSDFAREAADPGNYVELRGRDRIHALLDEYRGKKTDAANFIESAIPVEMPALGTAKATVSFSKGIVTAPAAGELEFKGRGAAIEVN